MLTLLFPGVLLTITAYTAFSLTLFTRDSNASKIGAFTGLIGFGIYMVWLLR